MPKPTQITNITSDDDGWGIDGCHKPNGDPCEGGCGGVCDSDGDD
jgi:hypothetical protein